MHELLGCRARVPPISDVLAFTLWQCRCATAVPKYPNDSPNPSPPDRNSFADRRAFPRVAVALPAFLQANGERHSVQLLDLSNGGARLTCPTRFPAGTEVTLDCGTLARGAVVRWQTDEFLGLSFDSELDTRDVSALADRSTALAARMAPGE